MGSKGNKLVAASEFQTLRQYRHAIKTVPSTQDSVCSRSPLLSE